MADSNVLDIVLRFLVDKNSQTQAQQAVNSFGKTGAGTTALGPSADFKETAASVLASAKELNIPLEQAAKNLAGMATGGFKTEQQILADVQAFQQMEQASGQVVQQVGNIDKNMKQVNSSVRMGMVGMTGFVLSMTGMSLQKLGQGILSPIQNYTKFAGMASGASAEWLTTQERLGMATNRIGQSLASTVLPTMQSIAGAAEKLASWMEANPAIAKAAAGFAGIAVSIGALLMVGGQVMSAAAAMTQLFTMIKGATLAGTAISAATATGGATVAAGAASGGILAGLGTAILPLLPAIAALTVAVVGLTALLNSEFGKRGLTAGKQVLTMAAGGAGVIAGALTGDAETANRWMLATAQALGLLGNQAQSTASQIKTASGEMAPQGAVDAYIAYQQQETQAAQKNEEQRLQIVQDFGRQRTDKERQNEEKRADILRQIAELQNGGIDAQTRIADARALRNFAQNERQQETSYYANRLKTIADSGVEAERAEEDHQRRMLQMQQDHDLTVEGLLDKQDAFGLLAEMRSYEQQRQQNEQSYQVETSRRNEDLGRRLAEMDNEFAQARARRMADYQQQRADEEVDRQARRAEQIKSLQEQLKRLDADHKTQMALLDQQETEKLNQLQSQYNNERSKRYANFADQLRDLGVFLQGETNLRTAYYAAWTTQYQQFMDANLVALQKKAAPNTTPGIKVPGFAAGGYVGNGLYQFGEEGYEYVLNHQTTTALEKLSQGRLSQSKINALLSGGGGGQTIVYNDQRRIDGRVTSADKRDLRNDMLGTLREAFA